MDEEQEVIFETLTIDEAELNKLSKKELISTVKVLLNYVKQSDQAFERQTANVEAWKKAYNDEKWCYDQVQPYVKAYDKGISLPFGFKLIKLLKDND